MPSQAEIQTYYNERYVAGISFQTRQKRFQQFLDPLDLRPGRKLLDIGCGEGFVLEIAQERGLSCFGIDISEAAVKRASCRALNHASRKVMVANGEALPFQNASFDYVTSIGTLEHFLHPSKGIREMARVCRDDGKLCIVVPNSFGLLYQFRIYNGTEQIQEKLATLNEWRSFLEAHDVEILHVGRDRGPDIFKDLKPHKLVQRLLLRLTRFMPLSCAYQFVFICQER